MKHTSNKRESPPPQIELRESPALLRAIYSALQDEAAAVTDYTYGQILFEKWLPAISDIFSTLSRADMHHYHALGTLLRDLGVSPALHTTINNSPYRLCEDADSHAPVLAQRVIKDRIQDEKNTALRYKNLSQRAAT